MSKYYVSVTRLIQAPAEKIFDLLADPASHAKFDGSGTVQGVPGGDSERLYLGASFGMDMKLGKKYRMQNKVTEFEEGRRIAWEPAGGYVWRYVLEPKDGGTLVTEEWDASDNPRRFMMGLLGFPKRNRKGITATLERLAGLVE